MPAHTWDDSTIYAEDTECVECGAIMSECEDDECAAWEGEPQSSAPIGT